MPALLASYKATLYHCAFNVRNQRILVKLIKMLFFKQTFCMPNFFQAKLYLIKSYLAMNFGILEESDNFLQKKIFVQTQTSLDEIM